MTEELSPDLPLRGKTVLVTGAARGIGRAIVEVCARRGARLYVADINYAAAEDVSRSLAHTTDFIHPLHVDVADESSVADMTTAINRHGVNPTDLVNNAAVVDGLERTVFDSISAADWERVFAVNVKGAWLCTRALAAHLRSAHGTVVNIASDMALTGAGGLLHYTTSKGAMIAMSRALATEFGQDHVRVNAVAPGFTRTAGTAGTDSLIEQARISGRALARPATTNDTAAVVAFLLSEDAAFMTGQCLVPDGGYFYH